MTPTETLMGTPGTDSDVWWRALVQDHRSKIQDDVMVRHGRHQCCVSAPVADTVVPVTSYRFRISWERQSEALVVFFQQVYLDGSVSSLLFCQDSRYCTTRSTAYWIILFLPVSICFWYHGFKLSWELPSTDTAWYWHKRGNIPSKQRNKSRSNRISTSTCSPWYYETAAQ